PVHASGVATAWLANAYDPRKPMDPRFAALVQTGVNRIYTDFTTLAAQARRSTPQKIDEVAQGRVWTGEQALERGLVDRLGGLREAMDSAAKRAKLEPGWRVVYMEREPGRLARLLGLMGTQVGQWALPWLQAARHDALATTLLGTPEWTDMADDLAWLTAARHQRRPFDAVVHCLCTPP
ncbi:MAG: S49 family peptidase, partial [Aquabacterium sp.]|nr:S49 family peptidase [Aquabacterium sp.]